MEQVTLKVPTINCDGCIGTIRRVLTRMPGVLAVNGDLTIKEVTVVRQEGAVTTDELVDRLAEVGHVVAGVAETGA